MVHIKNGIILIYPLDNIHYPIIFIQQIISRKSSRVINNYSRKTSTTQALPTSDYSSEKSRALSAPYLMPTPMSHDKRRKSSSDTGKDTILNISPIARVVLLDNNDISNSKTFPQFLDSGTKCGNNLIVNSRRLSTVSDSGPLQSQRKDSGQTPPPTRARSTTFSYTDER